MTKIPNHYHHLILFNERVLQSANSRINQLTTCYWNAISEGKQSSLKEIKAKITIEIKKIKAAQSKLDKYKSKR